MGIRSIRRLTVAAVAYVCLAVPLLANGANVGSVDCHTDENGNKVYTVDFSWTGDPLDGNATIDVKTQPPQGGPWESAGTVSGGSSGSTSNYRLGGVPAGSIVRIEIVWEQSGEEASAEEEVPDCP